MPTEEKFISFEVYNAFGDYYTYSNHNALALITSLDELKVLCGAKNYPVYQEDKLGYDSALSEKIRRYDESYFLNHALVLYFFTESRGNTTIQIDDMSVQDASLYLHASRTFGSAATAEIVTYSFLIEVVRQDVAGVVEVRTKVNAQFVD